jgi:hypothetical protein
MFTVLGPDPNNPNSRPRYWLPYNSTICRNNDSSGALVTKKYWWIATPNLNYILLCPTTLSAMPSLNWDGARQKSFALVSGVSVDRTLMKYMSASIFQALVHIYYKGKVSLLS